MEEKLLNNRIIEEIQSYLSGMDWTQKEFQAEKLNNFLRGIKYALYDKCLMLRLEEERVNYESNYRVDVKQYDNMTDSCCKCKLLLSIYKDKTEYHVML